MQGDFALHHKILNKINVSSKSVKSVKDLQKVDGLIIPGGESTTISLLIDSFKMKNALIEFGSQYPVLGTCAGLILMAKKVYNSHIDPLGLVDIGVERNAYGRQIFSEKKIIQFSYPNGIKTNLPATFIRAPKIKDSGKKVYTLGRHNKDPIAIISGHHICLSFHPELNGITEFHKILFDSKSETYYKNLDYTKYAA